MLRLAIAIGLLMILLAVNAALAASIFLLVNYPTAQAALPLAIALCGVWWLAGRMAEDVRNNRKRKGN